MCKHGGLVPFGRMPSICVSKLTIIISDNGLSPGRRQAIIWTNACWSIVNWTPRNKIHVAPEKCGGNFTSLYFKVIYRIEILGTPCEIGLSRWVPQNRTDDKSIVVQIIAWCRQATSHYLSQCWPRSMTSYGITRLQPDDELNHKSPSRLGNN